MKKVLVAVNVFLLACTFSFGNEKSDLDAKLEAAVSAATQDAETKALPQSSPLLLTLQAGFWGREDHVFRPEPDGKHHHTRMTNKCEAYALNSHWAIASARCLGDIFLSQKKSVDEDQVRVYQISDSYIKGGQWEKFLGLLGKDGVMRTRHQRIISNGNVMLVWHPQEVYTAPFVNVLATETPGKLIGLLESFSFTGGPIITRTRTLLGRHVNITSGSKDHFFRLARTSFPANNGVTGRAASALFGFNKQGTGFLAGFNTGTLNWSPIEAKMYSQQDFASFSADWEGLTMDDLKFIEETVRAKRPQDWGEIGSRLFYNTTKTPFPLAGHIKQVGEMMLLM